MSQRHAAGWLGTAEQVVSRWERKGSIPKTADRMFRAIYLEAIDGNIKLKERIERVVDLDTKPEEKWVFQDTEQGWLPTAA